MNRPLKIVIGLVLAGAAVVGLIFAFREGRAELEREREREKPIRVPSRVARMPDGSIEVHFDRDVQERAALQVAALAETSLAEEVEAYGQLAADPLDTFVVRSPFSGRLRAAPGFEWPSIGRKLDTGIRVGEIEPRIGPVEQLDLALRRSSIEREIASLHADFESAQAALEASSAALVRLKTLNEQDRNASDRAVQEAAARARADEARLHGTQSSVTVLEASLKSSAAPIGAIPVLLEAEGTVIGVTAHPGETVEAGQALFEVSRLESWLAIVSLPLGSSFDETATHARVRVESLDARYFDAERLGDAVAVDQRTRGRTLLLALRGSAAPLRAGAIVTAYLPAGGGPVSGVTVPRAAVVRYGGRSWVYVQVRDDVFTRREVVLDRSSDAGWFVRQSLHVGERAVVAGAQALLSEELKSQIRIGEGEEGQ